MEWRPNPEEVAFRLKGPKGLAHGFMVWVESVFFGSWGFPEKLILNGTFFFGISISRIQFIVHHSSQSGTQVQRDDELAKEYHAHHLIRENEKDMKHNGVSP